MRERMLVARAVDERRGLDLVDDRRGDVRDLQDRRRREKEARAGGHLEEAARALRQLLEPPQQHALERERRPVVFLPRARLVQYLGEHQRIACRLKQPLLEHLVFEELPGADQPRLALVTEELKREPPGLLGAQGAEQQPVGERRQDRVAGDGVVL